MTNETTASERERLIKAMVDRFLWWKLPKTFGPDGGVSFERNVNGAPRDYDSHWWPIGTNLLTAPEARAMVEHMLDGTAPAWFSLGLKTGAALAAASRRVVHLDLCASQDDTMKNYPNCDCGALPAPADQPPSPVMLRMQYVGACSLIGRLMRFVDNEEERDCMEQAINDCAAMFPDSLRVMKTTHGLSLEPKL